MNISFRTFSCGIYLFKYQVDYYCIPLKNFRYYSKLPNICQMYGSYMQNNILLTSITFVLVTCDFAASKACYCNKYRNNHYEDYKSNFHLEPSLYTHPQQTTSENNFYKFYLSTLYHILQSLKISIKTKNRHFVIYIRDACFWCW